MGSDTLVVCILTFILGFLVNDKIHATLENRKREAKGGE